MSWGPNKQKYSRPFTRAQNSGGAPLKTEGVAFKNSERVVFSLQLILPGLVYSTNSVGGGRLMLLVNSILIKVDS